MCCLQQTRFREAFYKENMIETIVRRLQTENQELQGYCASAIYKVIMTHRLSLKNCLLY